MKDNMKRAEKLLNKAIEKRKSSPHIVKEFPCTMENLQDNPEETKKVMLEYLAPHIDKISKLEIETNINSETFSPTILLRIWTPLCSPSDLLEKLSSTKTLNA